MSAFSFYWSANFSAPVTFLTYAPVYAVAGVALLLGAKPNAKELAWKVAAVLASGAVLWLWGFKDYLQGTSLISGRTSLYPAAFAAGAIVDMELLAGRMDEVRHLCTSLFPLPALS